MSKWNDIKAFSFPIIKPKISRLLGDGDGYAEKPMVDIELIARTMGFTIEYVKPEKIWREHPKAHAYIDEENSIIYVNREDNKEKQRFSIAHEIFHAMFKLANEKGKPLSLAARRGNTWKKEHAGSDEAEGEDIADYFAANLLIPAERFILWEEKSKEEIARAFGVEVRCIETRNDEIEHELGLMAPKNISSDVKIETQTPLSRDEMRHILGEYSTTHVAGRA